MNAFEKWWRSTGRALIDANFNDRHALTIWQAAIDAAKDAALAQKNYRGQVLPGAGAAARAIEKLK